MVPFPDEAFRDYILTILIADVVLCFCLDRLMKFIFCPHILWASVEGTTFKDVMGLSRTVAVMLFLMYSLLGNDDQWEEMMLQEGRYEELGLNATNMTMMNVTNATTNITTNITDAIVETVKEVVSNNAMTGEEF